MTCRPESPGRTRARRLGFALLALALLLAGPAAARNQLADGLLQDARAALARGDGIAAEVALRKAAQAGAARDAIAARMGEAFLAQGDLRKAREWLGAARFAPPEEAHGWRMLGRLLIAEHNLPAAGRAFDQVLRRTPRDSRVWVDIAHLRILGGEQAEAMQAAERAVQLDPADVRALELRGRFVRDRFGSSAALPWFEAGLLLRADDLPLLGEYAATLGELGRVRDMVVVTRRMLALHSRDPRALSLQAILAARAGDVALARRLLELGGQKVLEEPSGLLLSGMLELEAGNVHLAVELFDRLGRLQSDNATARLLLARAMSAAGDSEGVIARFANEASAPGASPYLQTLVARAYENVGRRDLAAPLLDAAARPQAEPFVLLRTAPTPGIAAGDTARVRHLVAAGNLEGAAAAAEAAAAAMPGAAPARVLAGDIRFLRGDLRGAMQHYQAAAAVRLTGPLMLRLVSARERLGDGAALRQLIAAARSANPRGPLLLRLEAGLAAADGNWMRASAALRYLAAGPSARDVTVLTDLAYSNWRSGTSSEDRWAPPMAERLQPLSAAATLSLGQSLSLGPASGWPTARAVLAKAESLGGSGRVIAEARQRMQASR